MGTVEPRSLCEPLRKVLSRVKGHFLQARAVDLDLGLKLVEIQGLEEGSENFYLPYDKLVIACGSTNATHGVPGLEHCNQLKTISDAQAIRRKIMDNLERAALPSTEEEERKRLLSFVICGGVSLAFLSSLFSGSLKSRRFGFQGCSLTRIPDTGPDWSGISVRAIRHGERRCDGFRQSFYLHPLLLQCDPDTSLLVAGPFLTISETNR